MLRKLLNGCGCAVVVWLVGTITVAWLVFWVLNYLY